MKNATSPLRPHTQMAPLFAVGDRVRCHAHRFNEEEPDHNGLFFADRHRALGHGEYCHGVIAGRNTWKKSRQHDDKISVLNILMTCMHS